MTRTHRFLGGVSLGYVHLIVVTLVGLWLTPFLLGRVGQHDYGLWLVALQIIAYLLLLDFGVVALLPRETAYATGRALQGEAPDALPARVAQIRGVVRWQMPLVVAAAAATWLLLPDDWAPLRGPFVVILATFVVVFPLRTYQAVLQGLQDLAFLGRVQIVAWTSATLAMVGLVLAGAGLYALIAGWAVNQAITTAACIWRTRRKFPHVWAPPRVVSWREAHEYLGRSVWVSVAQISQVLLVGTDIVILGALLGPAAVVPYACTAKLVQVLANHPQLLMQMAAPALSEMRTAESRQRLFAVSAALTRAMLLVSGAVGVVILGVNGAFVQWWVGSAQYGGFTLTAALIGLMIVRHLNTTVVYAIFCFGHERQLALVGLADGAVTLVASAIGVLWLGPIGAPLGSLAGVLAMSLPANLRTLASEMDASVVAVLANLRGWAVRFVICAVVATLVAWSGVRPALIPMGLAAALCGVVYLVLMVPLALDGPLAPYVRGAASLVRQAVKGSRPAEAPEGRV